MKSRWKVLIADDEPNNLRLMGQILKNHYQLSFATGGIMALEVARKINPDIILLDIMMPDMDGYEVCTHLKADPETAGTPVIFVSAMGEGEDELRGFDAGCVDYITKPVSAPIVMSRIKTHLTLFDTHRKLEEMVEQRTGQLSRAVQKLEKYSLETIHRLTRAAEYKDEDTFLHILRMSHYSVAVAKQMGLDEKETNTILHAAPMHDLGKIGVPDSILLKPGKLTAEEWEIMKQHTLIGGEILSGSEAEYVKLGETIALTHHEKWDGSGYPKGLTGHDIPLAGRIVAIADVFDALTSKRPYKDPFSIEKSFAIISQGSGNHFDPDVVDAFFAVKDEILSIKEKANSQAESDFRHYSKAGPGTNL